MEFDFDLYYFLKMLLASFLEPVFESNKSYSYFYFPVNYAKINFDFFAILAFPILIFNKEFFVSYLNEVIFYIEIILSVSHLPSCYSDCNYLL